MIGRVHSVQVRPRSRVLAALLLTIAGSIGGAASASGPAFWTVATAADFLRGRSDGVYVSLEGVLTAGPELSSRLTSAPAQIWSLTAGPDGTLWAGTGGDGRVIRLRTGQAEETVFDAEETNVFAVAVSGSRVYAATGPDGRVYVIDGTMPARPFFDPEEKYIWALAVDQAGRLWVGAGSPGAIYRVEPNGTSRLVYKPPVAHVVALVRDASGRVLAGTESPGRLYRLDENDRPFVILDSGMTELRAVSTNASGLTFAAAVARGDDPAPSAGEITSVAITIPPATPTTPSSTPATPPPAPARRSVIYRVDAAGAWEAIAETPDVIYDVLALADGSVLAASGPEGRLYRISPNRDVFLLTGVDAKQITRFAAGSAELRAFATANPGRIVTTGTRVQSPASFISAVRDTKSVSAWGVIRWESAGGVELFSRSGNTDKPDDSWSDWAGPYTRRDGEPIKSPPARFLQWRAVLTQPAGAAAARLTSVTVAYLPRNTRPEVESITVHPPGVVFQRPFANEEGAIAGLDDVVADARRAPGDTGPPAPSPGRRMFQKGLQTIVWKAEDGDTDHLSYTLAYRREGDGTWHELRKGLSNTIFVWDTTSVGDGRYVIRVTASDEPSNATDRALRSEKESDPITVDNTPPVVTTELQRQAGAVRLIVRVRDAQSAVQKLEYSLGGAPWQVVYPADGLADSPDERYEIALANEADASRAVVRATDALQNVTSLAVR